MGLDVYLIWDGQTEEEKEAQFTGFSIGDGHNGYLRVSYNPRMQTEHDVMCELFDMPDTDEPVTVNFLGIINKAYDIVQKYKPSHYWTLSLGAFLMLGLEKEKQGKNPKIEFSG
jgi:hypothetical protein